MTDHQAKADAPAPAASIRVRDMTDADCEAVALIRVRGWQTAYAGLIPAAHLAALSVDADIAKRREMLARPDSPLVNLVAERAGEVVGWACHGPLRRDDELPPGDAELYAIYVRPDVISTGVGRALLDVTLDRCAAGGFGRIRLWVIEGNVSARRFYERAGFAPDGATDAYEVEGVDVPELRYARELMP
ncbi:GNAT family N-acetyltransferase [Streptomyces sp. NPDC046821]|uniref:GNAT family N-acetyltransferase n=1 Tax=Streptomyces sp. NPDC046821 TaxID=3154702 RepID=UPI0033CC2BDC